MYTSVVLVALLGPGATPVVSAVPVRQVVYGAMPGQVIYIIPSSAPGAIVSPVVNSPTIIYSQPAPIHVSNGVIYGSPIILNGSPVISYGTPVYSSPVYSGGVVSSAVSYAPVSTGTVCRT